MCECGDRLVRVEHAERRAGTRKVVHRVALRLQLDYIIYVSRLPVYEMIFAAAELLADLTYDKSEQLHTGLEELSGVKRTSTLPAPGTKSVWLCTTRKRCCDR